MSVSKSAWANIFLVSVSTIIIIFAIVITAAVQSGQTEEFSQVITVGPVWPTNAWICGSNADYVVHAVLISYGNTTSFLRIAISGIGTQPGFEFTPLKMESFSIGGPADTQMTISSRGEITGYITLQTSSDATASCGPS